MSRITLKGKKEGSELVVGLDLAHIPELAHYFWQYWEEGEDGDVEDEGPDKQGESRSNYKLLEAIDSFADLHDPLTKVVRDTVGGDWDPARDVTKTHWKETALPDLVFGR